MEIHIICSDVRNIPIPRWIDLIIEGMGLHRVTPLNGVTIDLSDLGKPKLVIPIGENNQKVEIAPVPNGYLTQDGFFKTTRDIVAYIKYKIDKAAFDLVLAAMYQTISLEGETRWGGLLYLHYQLTEIIEHKEKLDAERTKILFETVPISSPP